jgi:hypothetical protein
VCGMREVKCVKVRKMNFSGLVVLHWKVVVPVPLKLIFCYSISDSIGVARLCYLF